MIAGATVTIYVSDVALVLVGHDAAGTPGHAC
jgi:hypothetical protein